MKFYFKDWLSTIAKIEFKVVLAFDGCRHSLKKGYHDDRCKELEESQRRLL